MIGQVSTEVFNFWYLGASTLTLIVLSVSAVAGFFQLRHLKKTRDLEYIQRTTERLFQEERFQNRSVVYDGIPHPRLEQTQYEQWLRTAMLKANDPNRYQDPVFGRVLLALEKELSQFELVAIYLRKAQSDTKPFFFEWFDVLARFTVLAADWIVNERKFRGAAYLQNAEWLFRENLMHMTSFRIQTVGFYHFDSNAGRVNRDLTVQEVGAAIHKLGSQKGLAGSRENTIAN